MKPQQFSGEGSLGKEPKRTFRERLRQACEAAFVSKSGYEVDQNGRRSLSIPKEIERRRCSYRAEDPIRTMMFLGSWSHT
ncbi:hypothetical protein L484_009082 [Morus notabilis]|uniref:Uncharacterized protein n=1 Tax=Morus notabilis TaxID=981085 RepID=W9QLX2_9ROSA|nr:hypothetical protein L484_009082 [Morus notabilis]